MRHPIDNYQAGRPWAICDRCGFQRRHDQLRKEWTGFLVCGPCFDPRPAQLDPPRVYPEGQPIPDARPDVRPPEFIHDDMGLPLSDDERDNLEQD